MKFLTNITGIAKGAHEQAMEDIDNFYHIRRNDDQVELAVQEKFIVPALYLARIVVHTFYPSTRTREEN